MFSTKARLIKRTGKNSVGRYDFLKLLAIEYKTTKSRGKKDSYKYSHSLINTVMLNHYSLSFSITRREGASTGKFGKLCL